MVEIKINPGSSDDDQMNIIGGKFCFYCQSVLCDFPDDFEVFGNFHDFHLISFIISPQSLGLAERTRGSASIVSINVCLGIIIGSYNLIKAIKCISLQR